MLHVKLANSPRSVAFSSTLTFPFQLTNFPFILCFVCRHSMPTLHFLNPPLPNAPSQPVDFQQPFDLSPFLAFGGPKCHRSKKMPSERVGMRKVLTKHPLVESMADGIRNLSPCLCTVAYQPCRFPSLLLREQVKRDNCCQLNKRRRRERPQTGVLTPGKKYVGEEKP